MRIEPLKSPEDRQSDLVLPGAAPNAGRIRGGPGTLRLAARGLLSIGLALLVGCVSAGGASTDKSAKEIAMLHTQLGIGYLREGKNDLAFDRLRRAVAVDPDYAPAQNALALLYERIGKPKDADEHFRRATDLDATNSAALTNYGSFLCRQNRVREAEERFRQAVENRLYPHPELAYTNAGLCMQRNDQMEKAETYFRRALEVNPKIAPALLAMSELSLEKGREMSARGYFERYLEVGPRTARSLWLGIRIERKLGDRNAVSSYAMLLKANYPDSPETRLLLESDQK